MRELGVAHWVKHGPYEDYVQSLVTALKSQVWWFALRKQRKEGLWSLLAR